MAGSGPKVEAIFGLHGWPGLKVGTVATKAGALLAATDNFAATFIGRGCHGAFPHLGDRSDRHGVRGRDSASSSSSAARSTRPSRRSSRSAGSHAGTAVNVIPDAGEIEGDRPHAHAAASASDAGRVDRAALPRRRGGQRVRLEFDW